MRIVSKGKVLNSPGFYEKKKRRRRILLITFLILILAALASTVYLLRLERFLINEIEVPGENIIDKEEITQDVRDKLSGSYLWLIPRSNALIYPRSDVKESLMQQFPRLKSVDLNLEGKKKLIVTVDERAPFALYCHAECFFLDEEGLIFAPAPSFSDGVYLIFKTEDPLGDPVGKNLLTMGALDSLLEFMKSLSTFNIYPRELKISEDEYILTLSNESELMWQRDAELGIVYSNLEAFLSSEAIKTQDHFLDRVLYLDLRTENKVFYKYRD